MLIPAIPLTDEERACRLDELKRDTWSRHRGSNAELRALLDLRWAERYELTIVGLESRVKKLKAKNARLQKEKDLLKKGLNGDSQK